MNLISFFTGIFGSQKHYYSEMESLQDYNTSNNNYEKEKIHSTLKANKNINSLSMTNDIVASIPLAYQRGVIGKKLNIQSRTGDLEFDREFEKYIKLWSKKGNCDITGRFARGLLERSLVRYYITQGGFLLRHHINSNWKIPYKVEVIPLHMIDYTKNDINLNIINGLKISRFGEIKEIYIYSDTSKTTSKSISYKDLTLFTIPIADATQYTGLSPLVPMLATLDFLDSYQKAELKSAKNRSESSIIIKTHLYNEILKIKQQTAKTKSQLGLMTEKEMAELYSKFKIKGGLSGANYIPSDDEVHELSNKADTIFADLDNSFKKTVSSSSGLSTQTTFREMPSSYNSALLNAQMDDSSFGILFEDFTELAWREVIEIRLLNALVASGLITAKDYWKNPDIYRSVEFMRASSAHIDPLKAEKASSEAIANGTSNPIEQISAKGKDWQSNMEQQILYELEYKKLRKEMYAKYKIKDDLESE